MAFEDVYADVTALSAVLGYYDSVNDDYTDVLRKLLPPGPAWVFEPGSDGYALLQALGYHFCRVAERAQDLLREIDPRTCYELLDDYEEAYDLPGDNPTPPTTIADRRAALHAKMLGTGDPSPATFESMADGLGYDAVVIRMPWAPFTCESECNWSLYVEGAGWPWVWLMLTATGSVDVTLRWLVGTIAPAHGKFLLGIQPLILGETFDDWTADDPDGWTVAESSGHYEVAETGRREGKGGTGTGSCNIWSDGSGTASLKQALAASQTIGQRYGLVFDVTHYGSGTLKVGDDSGNNQFYREFTTIGRKYIEWEASAVDVTPIFQLTALGDVTIDNVRLYGPLSIS